MQSTLVYISKILDPRIRIRLFGQKTWTEALYLERREICIDILVYFEVLLFCPEPVKFGPDPGPTEDVWQRKYENKKKALKII